jgi:hypothetical protein
MCGLGSCSSGWRSVADSCPDGTELSGSIKQRESIGSLNNCWHVMDSAPYSQLLLWNCPYLTNHKETCVLCSVISFINYDFVGGSQWVSGWVRDLEGRWCNADYYKGDVTEICNIQSSYSSDNEEYHLLGCDALQYDSCLPVFGWNALLPSSGLMATILSSTQRDWGNHGTPVRIAGDQS